jgi:hypothetical protein
MLDSSERARKEWRALFKAIKQIRVSLLVESDDMERLSAGRISIVRFLRRLGIGQAGETYRASAPAIPAANRQFRILGRLTAR